MRTIRLIFTNTVLCLLAGCGSGHEKSSTLSPSENYWEVPKTFKEVVGKSGPEEGLVYSKQESFGSPALMISCEKKQFTLSVLYPGDVSEYSGERLARIQVDGVSLPPVGFEVIPSGTPNLLELVFGSFGKRNDGQGIARIEAEQRRIWASLNNGKKLFVSFSAGTHTLKNEWDIIGIESVAHNLSVNCPV